MKKKKLTHSLRASSHSYIFIYVCKKIDRYLRLKYCHNSKYEGIAQLPRKLYTSHGCVSGEVKKHTLPEYTAVSWVG